MADLESRFAIEDPRYYGISFLNIDFMAARLIERTLEREKHVLYGDVDVTFIDEHSSATIEGYASSQFTSRTALSALTKAVRRVIQNDPGARHAG